MSLVMAISREGLHQAARADHRSPHRSESRKVHRHDARAGYDWTGRRPYCCGWKN